MDPCAPLKVKWAQVGVGARRIVDSGGALGRDHFVESAHAGGVNSVVLQGRNRGGGVQDQERDGVQPWFAAPPSRIAGKHDSLGGPVDRGHDERSGRRAGRVELTLVEDVRVRRHAAGLYPAGKHPLPFGVGLAERDDRLTIVNTPGHRLHAIEPGIAGDQESLIVTAARLGLRLEVLPGDRGAVVPGCLRIDGVGDDLRVCAGQLGAREVIGVEFEAAVGLADKRPRQRRREDIAGVRRVAVDVQPVEVVRERRQRQPQVAAVA